MNDYKFSADELESMRLVMDGADVMGYWVKDALKAIERKYPGLVTICEPMDQHSGAYCGAILTGAGREALAAAQGGAK
jgi:hypothetical protein